MATLQTVFDMMELLDRELELQTGGADVSRGIVAANMSIDQFESVAAGYPGFMGDTTGDVTTTASTEATTFPATLLRLDSMWFINASTSLPDYRLGPLYGSGSHRDNRDVPYGVLSTVASATGQPRAYWTDGTNIYWSPLPSGTHTVRWYGFSSSTNLTTAASVFPYPDQVMSGVAAFGAKLFQYGLDDKPNQYTQLANETFSPIIKAMMNFRREGPRPVQTTDAYYGW